MPSIARLRTYGLAIALVGVFGAVFGAKAFMIFRYGTDIPYGDEWAKAGEMILVPYREGTLRLSALFVPHNEHRIAPTLALDLALVAASGQWDARLACLANACLLGAIAVGISYFAWRAYGRGWGVLAAFFLALLGALPTDWENIFCGFQSQFNFLIGSSLLAIGWLARPEGPAGVRWWLGLVMAGLAGVSMGSGFLCFGPVLVIALGRIIARRRISMADAASLTLAVAALGLGWAARAPAPWDNQYHARSAGEFLTYSMHCLVWPYPRWPWLVVALWAPWLALTARQIFQRSDALFEPFRAVMAGGLWVLLQVAALAYGRGAGAGYPASRYTDILAVGLIFNLLSFARWRAGWGRTCGLGAWLAVALAGCWSGSSPYWRDQLSAFRRQHQESEFNVRGYLATGEAHYLHGGEQPFPFADWLQRILDRPAIRDLMPPSVRLPLPAAPATAIPEGFRSKNLPAGVPVPPSPEYWDDRGAGGAADWRSRPIGRTEFAYWKIEMTGHPSKPGAWLRLETVSGRPVSAPIAPSRVPGDTWRAAYVRLPANGGPFVLHAHDSSPGQSFGFQAPVEVSAWSEWGRQIGRQALWIWLGGFGLLVLGIACAFGGARGPLRALGRSQLL